MCYKKQFDKCHNLFIANSATLFLTLKGSLRHITMVGYWRSTTASVLIETDVRLLKNLITSWYDCSINTVMHICVINIFMIKYFLLFTSKTVILEDGCSLLGRGRPRDKRDSWAWILNCPDQLPMLWHKKAIKISRPQYSFSSIPCKL